MSSSILKGAAIAASATVFALVVVQAQPGCDGGNDTKPDAKAAGDRKTDTAPVKAEPDAKSASNPEPDMEPTPTNEPHPDRDTDAPDAGADTEGGPGGSDGDTKAEPAPERATPDSAGNIVPERKFFPASKSGIDLGLDKPASTKQAPNPPPSPAPNGARQQAGE